MADELRTLGVRLQVVEARSGVRDRLNSEGLEERIGRANRFVTVADALDEFEWTQSNIPKSDDAGR
jgi:hypothetical protein